MVGLFLHAFRLVLRSVRRQSRKMEEEVVSHGSRAGLSGRLGMQLSMIVATEIVLTRTGIIRSRTSVSRLRYWISYQYGPAFPQLLCPMWINSTRPLQRHGRYATQGCDRQVEVLRGNTHSICLFDLLSNYGYVDLHGPDTRQTSPGRCNGWIPFRISPERTPFRPEWCADDIQNHPRAQTMMWLKTKTMQDALFGANRVGACHENDTRV